jgi:hypothetical protein
MNPEAVMNDERELWRIGHTVCVMISCCTGAELQVRELFPDADAGIVLRELYPLQWDLFERASMLEAEYQASHQAARVR